MGIAIVVGYIAVALVAAGHAIYDTVVLRSGRDRYIAGSDYLILSIVAVMAGLLWIVLLPIYVAGWCRTALATRRRAVPDSRPERIIQLPRAAPVSTAKG